jgi:hypothetical protein
LNHKGTKKTKYFHKDIFLYNLVFQKCYTKSQKHTLFSLCLCDSKTAKPKAKNTLASFVPLWFKNRQTKSKKHLSFLCAFVIQKPLNQKPETP